MDAHGDRITHALRLETRRLASARRHHPIDALWARLSRWVTTARSWAVFAG